MGYKVDFKQLATDIDIGDVAKLLGLKVVKDRAACAACQGDDRTLQLFPETNSWRCHAAAESGDCIALYAHVTGSGMYKAALVLQEHFQTAKAAGKPATAPQKPEGRTAQAQPSPAFDPDAYAAKLAYNETVAALGISEDDAARIGIGYCATGLHRGDVAFALRWPTGEIAGFGSVKDGKLKLPPKLIPPKGNVVHLKRPA